MHIRLFVDNPTRFISESFPNCDMSNFQSDELLPVDVLSDPRKVVPLSATVETSGPPGEQAVLGELINSDFIENVADWISLPKTKKRMLSVFLNGQTAGTTLWKIAVTTHMDGYFSIDSEAAKQMLYDDLCLQLVVEVLGNPAVVGRVVSWFTPIAAPSLVDPYENPEILDYVVQSNQGVNITTHLALDTFRNGRSIWTIPLNKPFKMIRRNDLLGHNGTSVAERDEHLQIGWFVIQCLTDIRSRSTQTSMAQLIVWSSALVKYRGAAFRDT